MAEPIEISKFTKTIVGHPGKVMIVTGLLSLILGMIGIVVGNPELAGSFSVPSDPVTGRLDAFLQAREDRDDTNLVVDTRAEELVDLTLFFKSKSGDVFSQANLESIQFAQEKLLALPGREDLCQLVYDSEGESLGCAAIESPLDIVTDGTCSSTSDSCGYEYVPECQLVEAQYDSTEGAIVDDADVRARLFETCNMTEVSSDDTCDYLLYAYGLLAFDQSATCESITDTSGTYTRVKLAIGGPLKGYDSTEDAMETQWEELGDAMTEEDWINKLLTLVEDVEGDNSDIEVFFFSFVLDVTSHYLAQDMMLVSLSVVLVFIVIWRQTGSLFIASAGMYEILISFPLAYFGWTVLGQQEYVTVLIYLAIFLLLGIGADDIFVFMDAWRQSECQPPHISGSIETRFEWTYHRAAHAMLITSATTTVAFLMLAVSPIWDIACFGLVLAVMVVMDFALVITWFPASLVFYETRLRRRFNSCCLRCGCRKCLDAKALEYTADSTTPKEGADAKTGDASELRAVERFFAGKFFDFVSSKGAILTGFSVLLIAGTAVIWGLMLEPATEEPTFFDDEHIVTITDKIRQDQFERSATEAAIQTYLVYGIANSDSIDRSGVHPASESDRGVVKYDGLELTEEAQTDLIDVCDDVLVGAKERDLVGQTEGVYCFMKDFKMWREARDEVFPAPEADAVASLLAWKDDDGAWGMLNRTAFYPGYDQSTGFAAADDESKLLVAWVGYNTTMPLRSIPLKELEPLFDDWKDLMDEQNGLRSISGYQTNMFWDWMITQQVLVSSAITNVFVSVALAAVMLLISTKNWWLVGIATYSLLLVLSLTMALLALGGWEINVLEAICISVSTGLAVDYVVHLLHAYNEASGTRHEKLKSSLTTMGVSVVSGAITTLCGVFSLVFCQLLWFSQFGVFVLCLVSSSITVALFLLTGVLAAVGPQHDSGRVNLSWIPGRKLSVSDSAPAKPAVEMSAVGTA